MSLKIWLPLNGSTINQGVADFQPAAAGITYANAGKIGAKSYSGGSIKMSAAQTASIFNNEALTIAFWIKPTKASKNGIIFGNNSNRQFSLFQYTGNTSTASHGLSLHWSWHTTSGSGNNYDTAGNATASSNTWLNNVFTENTWSHVCVVYSKTLLQIYINGILRADRAMSGSASSFEYETYLINNEESSERRINDLRVYDHCLSPREVKLLAQGLVAHYKLDNGNPNLLNTLSGTRESGYYNYKFDRNGFGRFLTNGETCTLTICFTPTSNFQKFRPHFDNGNVPCTADYPSSYNSSISNGQRQIITLACAANYAGSNTPTTSNTVADLRLYVRRNSDSTYDSSVVTIHWIKLQIGTHTNVNTWSPSISEQANYYNTEYDCSGYGNHGTKSAILEANGNSPRYSYSTIFPGNAANRITNTTTQFNYTDNFSWSCWIKHNYTGWNKSGASYAFTAGRADAGGFGYGLEEASASSMRVRFGNQYYTISLNENWHHVAFTKSGTAIKIYVDGAETSYTFSGTLPTYSDGQGLGIGCFWYSGGAIYPYYGSISDFRIYATALSAAAVKEIYQSSISFLDNGTLQCSEIVENNTNLKYNQNGIVQANELNEIGYIDQMQIKTLADGSAWARIHWLDVSSNTTYFQNESEVLYCTNQSNRFSLMRYVDYFKSKENKYEFMLTYPRISSTLYNRWSQTSSPNKTGSVEGVSYIGSQPWTSFNGGIRKLGSTDCAYHCSGDSGWYAPIGQYQRWVLNSTSQIPAADGNSTTETELWVRIDNLPKLTKLSMFDKAIQTSQIYEL